MPKIPKRNQRYNHSRSSPTRSRFNNSASNRTLNVLQPGGFPDAARVRLTYAEEFTLDPSVLGVTATYEFSAVGLYDPNITGIGHQPLVFDQWMAIYSHYNVNKATITLEPTFVSSTNPTPPQVFGVAPVYTTGQFSALTLTGCIEKTKQAGGSYCNVNNINYGSVGTKLKAVYSRDKVFKDRGITDSTLSGSISANPTEDYIFSVWACGASASDAAAQTYLATIEFDVTFFERRLIPQS